jgi:cytochrome c oxidase subunit 1
LIWLGIGGLLALAIRWQLAWPWSNMPVFGSWLFADTGGTITPEFYTVLFTMHASVMIFFVLIPILTGGFGNILIPAMIGSRSMAFPRITQLAFWLVWIAFGAMVLSFLTPGQGSASGWSAYAPLSILGGDAGMSEASGSRIAQAWWLTGIFLTSISSLLVAINHATTILQMRTIGMSMYRLPATVWAMLVTSVMQLFSLPILILASVMQWTDIVLGTGFFIPAGSANEIAGGQVLLWQHLFWFYGHPAVYIMILPVMGMVSDMISCFARKPLFGYTSMVWSNIAIASLGFIVWGHHMFVSGMNFTIAMSFMVSTMLIALPSGIKVFNWIGTLWGGRLQLTTPMLFSIGFVSMFIIGGLSGVVMSVPPVDVVLHDTHYVVAHIHYVLFGSSVLGIFGAVYFWFPLMFKRSMNEWLGKLHFLTTFVFLNGTFLPMHLLSRMPRRYADPYAGSLAEFLPLNQWITWCAMGMAASQLIFLGNFLWSMRFGTLSQSNPWRSNGLEWACGDWVGVEDETEPPEVLRWPYEYRSPNRETDYFPQWETSDGLSHPNG